MLNYENMTIKDLAANCRSVEEIHTVLKEIFKETLEQALEAELENHLGYTKNDVMGNNTGNSRNGYNKKTISTRFGDIETKIPRDRNGNFKPQIIGKYEKTTNQIEDQVIAMYAKGMSTRDISAHMQDIYGAKFSPAVISSITEKVRPMIKEWQSRPLDPIYPVVFLDAIHFKVRKDNQVVNKAAYSVLGVNMDGQKDILGIWIGETESASFWLSVLNDLKNRGVQDILIISKDGLTGFSEAISAVFPKTEIQLCVIHQLRNNLKYVSYKDKKSVVGDLKKIYKALTLEEAELGLEIFKESWNKKYPLIARSWENHWEELTAYFKYPYELRKLIYTTNIIEGYHRQLRKVTKTKTTYPTDEALTKIIYLATMDITKKWSVAMRDWRSCLAQVEIYFADRLTTSVTG
jgi:transposase-like protein